MGSHDKNLAFVLSTQKESIKKEIIQELKNSKADMSMKNLNQIDSILFCFCVAVALKKKING